MFCHQMLLDFFQETYYFRYSSFLNDFSQVDSETVEGKLFPRISAVGERLWSNPNENWKNDYMEVEIRMVAHRQLLVERGIQADALQPEYCLLSEGSCELHNFEENSGSIITTSSWCHQLLVTLLLLKIVLFTV